MKIAIIGSGISGLTCAHYLNKAKHDIHLFEANDYVGGHTNTVTVETNSGTYAIDTGFIVFNNSTYPNFIKLLKELNVKSQSTDMSFSVHAPETDFQYAGGSLNGLFAQRRNIISPTFYHFLFEITRFQKCAQKILLTGQKNQTVSEFLTQHKFSENFCRYYLYPLISALWSTPPQQIPMMPIYFVASFFHHHALLKLIPDLPWQVIQGGSSSYVQVLINAFKEKIHVKTPIKKIISLKKGCHIFSETEDLGTYDKVIVATHSDQALALLDNPTELQFKLLSNFTYQPNEVILHTDTRLLPSNQRAWASWNYRIDQQQKAVLTYNMNRLQSLSVPEQFCVSLNAAHLIKPEKILRRFTYDHPQYTVDSLLTQTQQSELNRQQQIYFCGAYWGFGFHEDGVKSALQVCQEILHSN